MPAATIGVAAIAAKSESSRCQFRYVFSMPIYTGPATNEFPYFYSTPILKPIVAPGR